MSIPIIPLKLSTENVNAQNGPLVHFVNIQSMDLFVNNALINTQTGKINSRVHRIFRQITRPVTLFAFEQTYQYVSTLSYGNGGEQTEVNVTGDVLYDFAYVFVLPQYSLNQVAQAPSGVNLTQTQQNQRLTLKQFAYCTNLGAALVDNSIFYVDQLPVDQNKTVQQILLQNILRRRDQRDLYNQLIGNTLDNCTLASSQSSVKVYVPMKFFFSGSPQKAFQILRAGSPKIKVYTKIKSIDDCLVYTRNAQADNIAQTLGQVKNIGFMYNEIYLSDHERKLHGGTGSQQWLIEQNLYWSTTPGSQQENQLQPSNFMHPCKFMMYAAQKQKYVTKQAFLAYQPVLEGVQNNQQLIQDATVRFVLKFAQYNATCDLEDNIAGTGSNADDLTNTTGDLTLVKSLITAGNNPNSDIVKIEFSTDSSGLIQSCFVNVCQDMQQSQRVQDIFQRLQATTLQVNGQARFDQYGIILNADRLSIAEASNCVDGQSSGNWKSHLPSTVPFLSAWRQGTSLKLAQFKFSLYSSGDCSLEYGTTGQYSLKLFTDQGQNLFSDTLKETKFNLGLDAFDVMVNQWDNFGKYLDKTGSLINWIEYFIANISRFKQSSFYTETLHAFNYFPGKPAQCVNTYSFCLDPLVIQPTGTLNLSKGQQKITLNSDLESNDVVFFSLVVMNVMEFREGSMQVLYQTNFN